MAEYIEKEALYKKIAEIEELARNRYLDTPSNSPACARYMAQLDERTRFKHLIADFPTVDVVEVVRCGECIYYHPAHIKCPDGSEKGYNEMPAEAFDELGTGLVTLEYGINIGGQCEVEKYSGYSEDKSVFRRSDDFCSRGQGKERKNNG